MTIRVNDASGTAKAMRRLSINNASGAQKIVARVSINDRNGVAREAFRAAVSVAANPSYVEAYRSGVGPVTTSPVMASAAYGSPPYTFAWTFVDGNAIVANSPGSATTTFTGNALYGGSFASFRVTVTDGAGSTGSASVNVALYRVGGGGQIEQ